MAEKTAKKKPNIFLRVGKVIVRFFKDTRGEIKKIVWPSKKQVLNNTLVVAGFVALCAVLIFGVDALFNLLFQLIMQLGGAGAPAA